MIIETARELAKNHNVTVYCSNGGKRYTDFDGSGIVTYYDRLYREINHHKGILIAFKDAEALEMEGFDKRYLWTADAEKLTKNQRDLCDMLVAISPWHKQELKQLNPGFNKIAMIEPGIPLDTSEAKRIPKQCLYASSPDRGLDFLRSIWPEILEAHPDATLVVTYSKDNRKSNQEMIDLYHQSDILAYPCLGGERYCIAAIKAQMYGTIPCVIPTMALQDTVQYGHKALKKDYVSGMIHMLDDTEAREALRKDMMASVRYNNLTDVVDKWRLIIE